MQYSFESFATPIGAFPGTGAAGGLGFAFQTFLSASLEPGIQIILDETRLRDDVRDADLVITGEGQLDGQTVMGKANPSPPAAPVPGNSASTFGNVFRQSAA